MLCFDIGAYVGDKTQEMLDLGADKVIAVEPHPESYYVLEQRFKSNPKVTAVQRAVSDHFGWGILTQPSANLLTLSTLNPLKWFTGRFAGLTSAKEFKVKLTTLDALIKCYGLPDYIKIDVEGHEAVILRGLHRRIPWVKFEYSSEFPKAMVECLRLLSDLAPITASWSSGDGYASPYMNVDEVIVQVRAKGDWGDIMCKSEAID